MNTSIVLWGMSQPEERNQNNDATTFAWLGLDGGSELHITLPGVHIEHLSVEAVRHLGNSFARLADLIVTLAKDQERLRQQGRSLEGSLSFLSVHMLDVMSFFEQMGAADGANTSDSEFPF